MKKYPLMAGWRRDEDVLHADDQRRPLLQVLGRGRVGRALDSAETHLRAAQRCHARVVKGGDQWIGLLIVRRVDADLDGSAQAVYAKPALDRNEVLDLIVGEAGVSVAQGFDLNEQGPCSVRLGDGRLSCSGLRDRRSSCGAHWRGNVARHPKHGGAQQSYGADNFPCCRM